MRSEYADTFLARLCPGSAVVACDIYRPFRDDVRNRVGGAGMSDRIVPTAASMDRLPCRDGLFDLVWGGGTIIYDGIPEPFRSWRRLIRPGGHMGSPTVLVHPCSDRGCRDPFSKFLPGMVHKEAGVVMIRAASHALVDTMRLPDPAWWDRYYLSLPHGMELLKTAIQMLGETGPDISIEEEFGVFRNLSCEHKYFSP